MAESRWSDQSIVALRAALAAGDVTSVQLVSACEQTVAARNETLRAVIELNPNRSAEAAAADAASEVTGCLHGIPVLVKDNVETRDQPTTAGSLYLEDNETGRDAPLVARLREAGAVILGKANLSEWAFFRSNRGTSGWSAVGGQVRNPIDPTRSPCGSSSGSAVAVAAGMVPAAIGTETNGSIVCPASVNGVVGLKPTVGLVSQTGIVPISHSQDTAGPITRTVADAALVLEALTARPGPVDADPVAGLRLGVLTDAARIHPDVFELFGSALVLLEGSGVELVPDLGFETPSGFWPATREVLLYEFKADLKAYLAGLGDGSRSLEGLIAFNRAHAEREMPHFGQELLERAQDKGSLDEPAYREALAFVQRACRADGIDKLMAEHRLDALVTATNAPAWSIDWVHGDPRIGGNAAYPAVSGYPHITLPMGRVRGLPVGMSLMAGAGSEALLLRLAAEFEARCDPL